MRNTLKLPIISLAAAIAFIPSMASANGLLDSLPMIRIGNGAPITGSSNSTLGLGILTPEINGTPISVRVLGAEKLFGLSILNPALSNKPIDLQFQTPIDGRINSLLPK